MTAPAGQVESFNLTPRFLTAAFLSALLVTVGLGTATAPTACAGLIIGAVSLLQAYRAFQVGHGLTAQRLHHPRSEEGAVVTVELVVANGTASGVPLLEITDSFPPSGNYRLRLMTPLLPANSRVKFAFRQSCTRRRGLYVLGPVRLATADEMGMVSVMRTSEELTDLTVYPAPAILRPIPLMERPTRIHIGEEIVRRSGRSTEFAGLREYRAGDPPRLIHWRSSARLGFPHVKEFDRNAMAEVTVFCDLRRLSLVGVGDRNSVELRIQAAASIAAQAIERHHMVRIAAIKDPYTETALSGGPQHLMAILDWLAVLQPGGEGNYALLTEKQATLMRPSSTAVLLLGTTGARPLDLTNLVRLLRLRGIATICVLIDDTRFEKIHEEHSQLFLESHSARELAALLKDEHSTVYLVGRAGEISSHLALPA